MSGRRQLSTFYLDGMWFGIDALEVQEILRTRNLAPVPLAPPTIAGLLNLRGQIVTAIDLGICLQLGARGAETISIIIRTDDGYVSLLVDRAGDILEFDDNSFERPPETLQGRSRDLIQGVYKHGDQLLHSLDLPRLLNHRMAWAK